jgi:hypothetical protein
VAAAPLNRALLPKSAVRTDTGARYPSRSMRLARTFALASIAATLVAGCDAFRSFEAVCEQRLPAAKIEVTAQPVTYRTDLSLAATELAAKGAHTGGRTLMGLVTADLKSSVTLGGSGIAERGKQRFCMRPAVTVRLEYSPMTLYIAREHPEGSCAHRITLEHEYQHIRVYQQYLDGIAKDIDTALRADLGGKVLYFHSEAEGDAHVQKILEERLAPYVENTMRQVMVLQKQVDSPQEYARLDRAQADCEAGNVTGRVVEKR